MQPTLARCRPGDSGRVRSLTLDQLQPGEHARVTQCRLEKALGPHALVQRLCEMGLVPGAAVRVVRFAPFGDPMEVEVYGYHLSLRKSEAAWIEVERTPAPEPTCGSV